MRLVVNPGTLKNRFPFHEDAPYGIIRRDIFSFHFSMQKFQHFTVEIT